MGSEVGYRQIESKGEAMIRPWSHCAQSDLLPLYCIVQETNMMPSVEDQITVEKYFFFFLSTTPVGGAHISISLSWVWPCDLLCHLHVNKRDISSGLQSICTIGFVLQSVFNNMKSGTYPFNLGFIIDTHETVRIQAYL